MAEKKSKVHLNVAFGMGSNFSGRSVENGVPVTLPLYDLEDLLAWKPHDSRDAGQSFSVSTVPYYGKVIPKGSTKTLVCHDMAGGYLDDRFVQGCLSTDDQWYYLAYWDVVDTFVYFSHHFITIPPVGWINSAHTNGVAVLGTFITEGDVGFKRCDVIFSKEWIWKAVADQMVEIAKFYRFEGWLLNIENNVDTSKAQSVCDFVKYLTDKMHDAIEGSQVIWYDSITEDGTLDWQNQLNSRNEAYFDACDGIFLNYSWYKDGLENSVKIAQVTSRVQDVYVGVDVFGRGCPGGGGMNSATALEVIRKYDLSAAIFAPGWVKEELGAVDFEKNQHKFWNFLSKYCNTHSIIFDCEKQYLATDFDPGMCAKENGGKSLRFLNLNQQDLLPCLSSGSFLPVQVAESGEAAVTLQGELSVVIFKVDFRVKDSFIVVFLALDSNLELDIRLKMKGCIEAKSMSSYNISPSPAPSKYFLFELQSGSVIDEIVCRATKQFTITKLILSSADRSNPVFLYQDRFATMLDISITLKNVTWARDTGNKAFLHLSCSLELDKCDLTLPIKIYYKFSSDDEEKLLGVSRCDKYRINALSVPNPVLNGPGTAVIFKVEQDSPVYPVRRVDLPPRVGELVIAYDENMPYDPSTNK